MSGGKALKPLSLVAFPPASYFQSVVVFIFPPHSVVPPK
jgi:hypothetical protein